MHMVGSENKQKKPNLKKEVITEWKAKSYPSQCSLKEYVWKGDLEHIHLYIICILHIMKHSKIF